jgi:SAM-dependent methyltransferase
VGQIGLRLVGEAYMQKVNVSIYSKADLFNVVSNRPKAENVFLHSKLRLKTIQDIAAFDTVMNRITAQLGEDFSVADVGGDQTRILPMLVDAAPNVRGTIIDTWAESIGNGTVGRPEPSAGVSITECLMGSEQSRSLIPDATFDAVVSISVLEHVPIENLANVFVDCLRVCRPGGIVAHFVDIHLSETRDNKRGQAYIDALKEAFNGPAADFDDWRFKPGYASNPDDIMFRWGKRGNNMARRAQNQAVCLVIEMQKPAI